MKLFEKETIQKRRNDQTRELVLKNQRMASSLKKALVLQNDIDFDAEKAKKVRDYQMWCVDIQERKNKELGNLKAYTKLVEDKKEEYYQELELKDALDDKVMNLKEEIGRLDLQIKWKQSLK